jgi:ribosomal-protein-alanine N-acetyltransferase
VKTEIDGIELRPFCDGDQEALVRAANHPGIADNLRNRFPFPYTRADADEWIAIASSEEEVGDNFAIVDRGELVGGIGLEVNDPHDVQGKTAGIGYWLTPSRWRRGIATAAVRAAAPFWMNERDLERLEAGVYDWNPASGRVLEKAGFTFESRQRRKIIKGGRVCDLLVYARLRAGS